MVLPSRFQQPAFNTVGDELRSVQVQGLDVESARLAQGAWSRPQNHLATDDGEGPWTKGPNFHDSLLGLLWLFLSRAVLFLFLRRDLSLAVQ